MDLGKRENSQKGRILDRKKFMVRRRGKGGIDVQNDKSKCWMSLGLFCLRRESVWLHLTPQVESGYVAEGDHKTMAKAIKDRVSLIRRKREQRQLVREEQEKRKLETEQQLQQQQQQQQEALKPSHAQVC